MGLVVGSEWRAALWRSCRAAQSPMRARGMSTCLGPYRGFWVLDSGAFHRQVCGQTGVTGRKADVQLAAWTVRHAGRKRLAPAGRPTPLAAAATQLRSYPSSYPSSYPAATPQLPRSYPAASPRRRLQWRGGLGWPPGLPPHRLPPRERPGLCLRVQAGEPSGPCPRQAAYPKGLGLQACTVHCYGCRRRSVRCACSRPAPRTTRSPP